MREAFAQLDQLAPTTTTVTLLGETGTGKDVFAHLVHDLSPRAQGPFVVFDCGSVPAHLVESDLFGHERGAFTGAHSDRPGVFERADGGTLFFDEIGELPLELQSRLLRVLDSQAVRRVGGSRDRKFDVRIVAATNRDLARMVAAQHFRQDLYFRLAVAVVKLPPLRERREDLRSLCQTLLVDLGRSDAIVTEAAFGALRAHPWPGNIRELRNALACALAFAEEGIIEPRHLKIQPAQRTAAVEALPLAGSSLEDIERVAIAQTLHQTKGNKLRAASLLGIARSNLYAKIEKYGLDLQQA